MEKMLTLVEAAEACRVPIYTLRRWVRIGKVPVVRFGFRTVRMRATDLEAVVQANWHPARDPQR